MRDDQCCSSKLTLRLFRLFKGDEISIGVFRDDANG